MGISKEKIDRINKLYHKSKSEGLSNEEKLEQEKLRREYIAAFKSNLRNQLDSIKIKRPDGTIENVRDRRRIK